MRLLQTTRAALLGAILMTSAALTMITAPAVAIALPAVGTPSVPILGQVTLKMSNETGKPAGVGTLHGVRRIPGGTVIYFSIGYPHKSKDYQNIWGFYDHLGGFSRAQGYSEPYSKNMLVDSVGKKVYGGLMRSDKSDCICNGTDGSSFVDYEGGEADVLYQVVAALPDSVTFVDVEIAGQVIGHVKVEDGLMTPEVDASKPILLGMGWPKVDTGAVASSFEPAKSVVDLTTSVADLEGTVTTRATPKQISVALASDVLFATDSATLSPKAQAVLRRAAADVKAAGGTGTLQVIGYTDNTGATDHNVDLSKYRAAAVAAAMKPMLPAGIQLPTSGKGEADPVATNDTPKGQALNRRVSINFAPTGGAK